jgi:pSer/pThr/pTyr-binding forkhead associated (FHA) protein
VPVAVVFLLRAVVLILLWGFVVAAIVAVRHDVFGTKPAKAAPLITPPAAKAPAPPPAAATKTKRGKAAAATQLVVVDGPAAGATAALSSLPVTIGRAPNSGLVLNDDFVSNNHARLVPNGQDWLVEDAGSTNGTFIGDTKVNAPTVVPVGGRFRVGRNILELR